jgi:hypothetical protein
MSSRFQDLAASLSFGPLFHFYIPGHSNVSSRLFVLSGFLVQHCHCCVPDDRVLCTVPLLRNRLSLCGQRPISSGTHPCPASVSSGFSAPYGQILIPMPLIQCSVSFHCSISFSRDLLGLYISSGFASKSVAFVFPRQAISFHQAFMLAPILSRQASKLPFIS